MHTVGRWALRVPDGTDGPPNVPLWMDRLAVDLTDVAKDNQGTLAARPASSGLAPGIAGRYFTTTDELDGGAARRRVYRDMGTAWDELATLPVSRRMVDSALARELPSALLTVAQFLALGAQPDGTVVRVQLNATRGTNARFRFNAGSASAYKWEADGVSAPLWDRTSGAEQFPAIATPTYQFLATQTQITAPLAGDYYARFGATATPTTNAVDYNVGVSLNTAANQVLFLNFRVPSAANTIMPTANGGGFTAAINDLVRLSYWSNGGQPTFRDRFLEITPIRVAGP